MAMAGNVHPLHLNIGEKCPDVVNAVIEIPEGSKVKYEIDKETGARWPAGRRPGACGARGASRPGSPVLAHAVLCGPL